MPELPDIVVYVEHLQARLVGRALRKVALANPFVLRTAEPLLSDAADRDVTGVRRLGKRIVLMLAGVAPAQAARRPARSRWRASRSTTARCT